MRIRWYRSSRLTLSKRANLHQLGSKTNVKALPFSRPLKYLPHAETCRKTETQISDRAVNKAQYCFFSPPTPLHSLDPGYPVINTRRAKKRKRPKLNSSFVVCSLVPIMLIGQGLLCEGDYIPPPKPHTIRCGAT